MDIKKTTLALVAGMMVSGSVWASAPKSDSTEIQLSVVDGSNGGGSGGFVMLRQLEENINLGEFSNTNTNPTGSADFCIYASGVGDSKFAVNLSVAGGGAAADNFALKSGDNKIEYSVDLYNAIDKGGAKQGDTLLKPTPVATPVVVSGIVNPTINKDLVCSGTNASVAVSVSPAAISSAPAGTYKDTLTLTVSAN